MGTDPLNVVQSAIDLFERQITNKSPIPYEMIFCVFDGDHAYKGNKEKQDFFSALRKSLSNPLSKNEKKKTSFYAIVSTPCFEYWLILNFKYSTAPYPSPPKHSTKAKKSMCDHVGDHLNDIMSQMGGYQKKDSAIYGRIEKYFSQIHNHPGGFQTGLIKARRAAVDAVARGDANPSTDIHLLTQALLDLT